MKKLLVLTIAGLCLIAGTVSVYALSAELADTLPDYLIKNKDVAWINDFSNELAKKLENTAVLNRSFSIMFKTFNTDTYPDNPVLAADLCFHTALFIDKSIKTGDPVAGIRAEVSRKYKRIGKKWKGPSSNPEDKGRNDMNGLYDEDNDLLAIVKIKEIKDKKDKKDKKEKDKE